MVLTLTTRVHATEVQGATTKLACPVEALTSHPTRPPSLVLLLILYKITFHFLYSSDEFMIPPRVEDLTSPNSAELNPTSPMI